MPAVYPGSTITYSRSGLHSVGDLISGTTETAIVAGSTTVTVDSTTATRITNAGITGNFPVTVGDTEQIFIQSVAGQVLTFAAGGRGSGNPATPISDHGIGSSIELVLDSVHIAVLSDEVKAIEEALGASLSNVLTPTNTKTVTNKSLVDSSTYFVDVGDNTKRLQFDVTGTTGITGVLQTTFTTAKTITFPDATDTVALLATVQALTGKTYNGLTLTPTTGTLTLTNGKTLTISDSTTLATNSITFAGTEVLTLAATKNVTFADAFATSGAFSLTLTATAATSVTLPTSGTLATLAGTETLTGKTLTSPFIATVLGGSAVGSSLTLQSTSGVGTTDSVIVKVGNNGATTAATFTTAGQLQLPVTSSTGGFLLGTTANFYENAAGQIATDATLITKSASGLIAFAATSNALRAFKATTDAEPFFRIDGTTGKLNWGAGVSSAADTNLYRSAADILATDDVFSALTLRVTAASDPTLQLWESATRRAYTQYDTTNNRINIVAEETGSGIAFYTNNTFNALISSAGQLQLPVIGSAGGLLIGGNVLLYQYSADILGVDDDILVTRTSTTSNAFETQVTADANTRFSIFVDGKMEWGIGTATRDTNLYRVDTNVLGTDDAFAVRGGNGIRFYNSGNSAFATLQFATTSSIDVLSSNYPIRTTGQFAVADGITAPGTMTGYAQIYVDSADGDLKVKFGDGTVKTIVVDT